MAQEDGLDFYDEDFGSLFDSDESSTEKFSEEIDQINNLDEIDFSDDHENDEDDVNDDVIAGEDIESDSVKGEDTTAPKEDSDIEETPIFLLAKQWKDDFLLTDEDIKPDLTALELETIAFERMKQNVEARMTTHVKDKLTAMGVDPDAVFDDSGTYADTQRLNTFRNVADLSLEDLEDEEEQVMNLGVAYYVNKGNTQEDAKFFAEKEVEEKDISALFDKYRGYFESQIPKLEKEIESKIAASKSSQKQINEGNSKQLSVMLDKGVIGGVQYTKEEVAAIKAGIFDLNQIVVDNKGNRRRVTMFDKVKQEIDNDIEMSLSIFATHLFNKTDEIKERAVAGARRSVLSEIEKQNNFGKNKTRNSSSNDEKGLFRPL